MTALNPKNTMQIATSGKVKKPILVVGKKARLIVGDQPVMFFIHDATLSHFASGFRFGQLNPIKIRNMCHRGTASRMNDRQAAQALIDDKVATLGADKIHEIMNAAPVINQ